VPSRVEIVAAAVPALQRGIEVGQPDLGQEAENPQVHAENGRSGRGKDPRHGKQRAVAAQNDHQSRRLFRHRGPVDSRRSRGVLSAFQVEQRLIPVLAQPGNQLRQQPNQFLFSWFADDRDSRHGFQCNGSGPVIGPEHFDLPRRVTAKSEQPHPCPIHFAFFAEWVGILEPKPAPFIGSRDGLGNCGGDSQG
jgi:hypothetical protein